MIRPHESEFNQSQITHIKSQDPQKVAKFVWKTIHPDIEREKDCGNKKERERERYQLQNAFLQAISLSPEKIERKNIHSRNNIFADFFERGESGSFQVSDRKNLPVKDHHQEKREEGQISQNNGLRPHFFLQKKRGDEESDCQNILIGQPKLGGDVGISRCSCHDTHAPVGESVDQANHSRCQKGHPEKKIVVVFHEFSGIPGQKKNRQADGRAEKFGQNVKKKIIEIGYNIQRGQNQADLQYADSQSCHRELL